MITVLFKLSGELLRSLRLPDVLKDVYIRVVPPTRRIGEGINPIVSDRRSAQTSGTSTKSVLPPATGD